MLDLGDVATLLHVGSIAAGTENNTHTCAVVNIVRSNQGTSGIVDQRLADGRHFLKQDSHQ